MKSPSYFTPRDQQNNEKDHTNEYEHIKILMKDAALEALRSQVRTVNKPYCWDKEVGKNKKKGGSISKDIKTRGRIHKTTI